MIITHFFIRRHTSTVAILASHCTFNNQVRFCISTWEITRMILPRGENKAHVWFNRHIKPSEPWGSPSLRIDYFSILPRGPQLNTQKGGKFSTRTLVQHQQLFPAGPGPWRVRCRNCNWYSPSPTPPTPPPPPFQARHCLNGGNMDDTLT